MAISKDSGQNELLNRILFVIGALLIYRIGSFIPVPGHQPRSGHLVF